MIPKSAEGGDGCKMKVIIIGLGSMGKRRIRLMRRDPMINIIGIDTSEERRKEAEGLFSIKTYADMAEVSSDHEIRCAFIATSPLSHHKIISKCLSNGWHVFTELNLVADGYDENMRKAKENHLTLFLSSTFLYREEINYINKEIKSISCPLNYVYHVGQYLSDWHPWEDYTEYFVADKRSNGCREILAIELPWMSEVFSKIIDVSVVKKKNTALKIDYPDSYLITLEHENGTAGLLAVDIISRKAVRNLEIYGEDIYLSWDGSPKGLYQYDLETKENVNIELYQEIDKQNEYASFVIENAYLNEMIEFFKILENPDIEQKYGFEKDLEILKVIDRIEE